MRTIGKILWSDWFPIALGVIILVVMTRALGGANESNILAAIANDYKTDSNQAEIWTAPDIVRLNDEPDAELLRYGRELIANTSKYFGPAGIVAPIANGLNCQNCHLDAGTRPF